MNKNILDKWRINSQMDMDTRIEQFILYQMNRKRRGECELDDKTLSEVILAVHKNMMEAWYGKVLADRPSSFLSMGFDE